MLHPVLNDNEAQAVLLLLMAGATDFSVTFAGDTHNVLVGRKDARCFLYVVRDSGPDDKYEYAGTAAFLDTFTDPKGNPS